MVTRSKNPLYGPNEAPKVEVDATGLRAQRSRL